MSDDDIDWKNLTTDQRNALFSSLVEDRERDENVRIDVEKRAADIPSRERWRHLLPEWS